jgi:hypothetical protein
MRDVYAVLLTLDGDPGGSFATAVRQTLAWSVGKYGETVPPDEHHQGSLQPTAGVAIDWSTLVHPIDPAAVWTLRWTHPHEDEPGLQWSSRVQVGYDHGGSWFSLRIAIQPVSVRVRPIRFRVYRPNLVPRLLREPGASADGRHLSAKCWPLDRSAVPELADLLLSDSRTLPVVVVTRPSDADEPLIDPDGLANRLAGLAHVAFLRTRDSTFALTNSLGSELSVFEGAIRLYWPGFTSHADRSEHPLWFADTIRRLESEGRPLTDRLFDTIHRIALFRLPSPTLQREIRRALDEQRSDEIRDLRKKARQADLPEEWLRELERALDGERDAKANVALLEKENSELREQLSVAQQNIADLSRQLGQILGQPPTEIDAAEEWEPTTVLEATRAARASANYLVFLDEVEESAAESPYAQPEKILRALRHLDDIAGRYATDQLPQGFRAAFDEAGLEFASDISDTAKTKHGRHYLRWYEGKQVMLGPHIKLGIGSPDTCARIYFHLDKEHRRIVVGHVGKHLPDEST